MNFRAFRTAAALALVGVSASAQSPATEATSITTAVTVRADSVARSDTSVVRDTSTFVQAVPAGVTNSRVFQLSSTLRLENADTIPRRRAVAYSDWYSRRLTVHRYGSYVMLPLFVTQFVLGNKLLNQKEDAHAGSTVPVDQNLRHTHAIVAGGVGALFVVNTTTGLWNLFESRHTVEGRKRRTIHALTMLAADAGFAYTGYLGTQAKNHGPREARKHRNMALTSFGISTAGASLMWFGRN